MKNVKGEIGREEEEKGGKNRKEEMKGETYKMMKQKYNLWRRKKNTEWTQKEENRRNDGNCYT